MARLRNAKPFYDDAASALAPTKVDVDERMRKHGLSDEQIQFIHDKVFIDVGHGDLSHDERALELFIARLLSHPEFAGKIRAMVQPAYAELIRRVSASKGVVLDKASIEGFLRSAVLANLSARSERHGLDSQLDQGSIRSACGLRAGLDGAISTAHHAACRRLMSGTTTLFRNSMRFAKQIMTAGAVRTIPFAANAPCPRALQLGPHFLP